MKKENLKKEIYDILFYERPAAPYATGKCIYFREEDRLLKAHPLSEMRRIYEEVNNIRILNDMGKRKLTLEERDSIVNELLLKGQNAGSNGAVTIDFVTDARMTSPKDKNLQYMFVDSLVNRGLSYFTNNKARKVELTPFGKIKKKHKVLWNGTKTTA